jgi:serralysin
MCIICRLAGRMLAESSPTSERALDLHPDATLPVALNYQFFTGQTPSLAGLDYLISPLGPNPNNLNSAAYQGFDQQAIYVNLAVGLGLGGSGAQVFVRDYGSISFEAAAAKAYEAIIGTRNAAAAGIDVKAALAYIADHKEWFEAVGGDELGAKAAVAGWLMFEGEKAGVGTYSTAGASYMADIPTGAPVQVDLVGVYGHTPPPYLA